MTDNPDVKRLSLYLPKDVYEALRAIGFQRHRSMNGLAIAYIKQGMEIDHKQEFPEQ